MTAEPSEYAVYYRVEVAARLAGISPARLRRFEAAGLVHPARRLGSRSLYREPEVARLRKIRRLTDDLGINLAGVEVVLRLTDELAALRARLGTWPDTLRRLETPSPLPRGDRRPPQAP